MTLLGIIIEKPISAYDLKKEIEYRNLNEWTKISYPTIYKKVGDLENKGYLNSSTVQNMNYAPKQVYQITTLGIEYFDELMEKISKGEVKIPLDINAIVANLEKVTPKIAISLIQNMIVQIEPKIAKLDNVYPNRQHIPACGMAIITQQLDFYKYLKNWLLELQKIYMSRLEDLKNE